MFSFFRLASDGCDVDSIESVELLVNELELSVYRQHPSLKECAAVVKIQGTADGEAVTHIGAVDVEGGKVTAVRPVVGECKIMMDDLPLPQVIQYMFEDDKIWRLGCVGIDALQSYQRGKFDAWKKMLFEPTCEAQFRRMLQCGIVVNLYDAPMS